MMCRSIDDWTGTQCMRSQGPEQESGGWASRAQRDRPGDVCVRLKDDSRAAAQYEECLSRYPKSWNAPEVRRKLEQLRRDRRF